MKIIFFLGVAIIVWELVNTIVNRLMGDWE